MKISAKKLLSILLVISVGGMFMFGLSGCFAKRYKVDYCGQKSSFEGAKDSCKAGEKVELKFKYIATDTDYYFYVDGERVSPDYDSEGGGYVIRFTMPEHDVTVKWSSKNSMLYEPEKSDVMLVDYYTAIVGTDGYDRRYELVLSTAEGDKAKLEVYNGTPDDENCSTYLIPGEAEGKCFDIINSTKMRQWNDICEDTPIDGAVTAVKFKDDDGSYIRVSTDKMPPDGEQSMNKIKSVLEGYIKPEHRVG